MATPTTTIRLPGEIRRQLDRIAELQQTTNTDIIITALKDFLSRQDAQQRRELIERELERLAEIDRHDQDFLEFYGEPEESPFRDKE